MIKVVRTIEEEVEIYALEVHLPADEVEDNCNENDLKTLSIFKKDDKYVFQVCLTNNKISFWPVGSSIEHYYKIVDEGTYILYDVKFNVIFKWDSTYVPCFLNHKDGGGDYLDFTIDIDGTWKGLNVTKESIEKFIKINKEDS